MSERPDTAALLTEVRTFFRRFVSLPGDHYHDAVALWVLHAHAIAAADDSPRLVFKSPEKESGKTRALEVLEVLTPAPLNAINATVAAIFRLLKDEAATLLFDEVDAIFSPKAAKENEELRALINAGYHRGANVARVVGIGTKMFVQRFPVFAAMALAAIGDLPETIESRAIIVPMRRRAPGEAVEQFRRRWAESESGNLRGSLAEWAEVYSAELGESDPVMVEGVTDRAADCWAPLLAIADLAGGPWPELARNAAREIVAGRLSEDQSLGVRLLVDIKAALNGDERLSTVGLLTKLNGLDEAGWGGWNAGKGMGPRDLARKLKPFGIAAKVMRLPDGSTPRCYERDQFADSWSRYLRDTSATSATKRNTDPYSKTLNVADVDVVEEREERGENGQAPLSFPVQAQQAKHPQHRSQPVADVAHLDDLAPEQLDQLYRDAVMEVEA